MRRWMTFLFGIVIGVAVLLGAQRYHLIRADDGFHLIPKVESRLAATYVDIRSFTVTDWAQHADVARALVDANQDQLMEDATGDAVRNQIDRFLDRRNEP